MSHPSARSRFAASAVTYILSNFIQAAIPFALLPVLARHLTPSQYGEAAMFQAVIAALAAAIGLNVTGAATRRHYDRGNDEEGCRYYVGACFQIVLVTTTFAIVVVLLMRDVLSRALGLRPVWLVVACTATAAQIAIQMRMAQWQVRHQARRFGQLQIGQAVTNVMLSLLFVVTLRAGASGRMAAQASTTLAFAVVALFCLKSDNLVAFAWRPELVRDALGFGVPLLPHTVGMFLLTLIDRFAITSLLGLGPAGAYMVAVQLASGMGLISSALNSAYVPWLFERLSRNQPAEKLSIVRMTYWYFFVSLTLAALAFVVGPHAIRALAGARYQAAGEVLGWLAVSQAFSGMYLMVTNYIFYSKRTGALSVVTISSGAANVALMLLLIPALGIRGAAVASAISMGVRFFATWILAQRCFAMPWLLRMHGGPSGADHLMRRSVT